MRAINSLTVFALSLGLAVSGFGDVQAQKPASKSAKPEQKQIKKDAKHADKSEKKGIKRVFSNPFKRHPKAQEADCRKFPNAAGCPTAKQAKQMEKQVYKPEKKTAAMKHGKPMAKAQAFKAHQKPAKKNAKAGKKTDKKVAQKDKAQQ